MHLIIIVLIIVAGAEECNRHHSEGSSQKIRACSKGCEESGMKQYNLQNDICICNDKK